MHTVMTHFCWRNQRRKRAKFAQDPVEMGWILVNHVLDASDQSCAGVGSPERWACLSMSKATRQWGC